MTRTQSVVSLVSVSLALSLGLLVVEAQAAFVTPMRGGGTVPNAQAPMIHCDLSLVGTNLQVMFAINTDSWPVLPTDKWPELRALTPPDELDPNLAWSVLQNKAYNWQYAWASPVIWSPPEGTGVWVERLGQDSGLETFGRPPSGWGTNPWPNPWPAMFTQNGDRWKWGGTMTHNAYAVLNPTQSVYAATYRVYIGDAVTGVPDPGYGSADVTWNWHATPVPEPATAAFLGCSLATLAVRRRLGMQRGRGRASRWDRKGNQKKGPRPAICDKRM